MKNFQASLKTRQRNWRLLREGLKGLEDRLTLPEPTDNSDPSWFGFMLTVKKDTNFTRDQIVAHLESKNIQTRMLFAGNLIKHPCFDELRKSSQGFRVVGELKNTDLVMNSSFWVGVYPGISEKMIEFMVETIKESVC